MNSETNTPEGLTIAQETEDGRVLVGDSLTYVKQSLPNDVVVCGSFAGAPTMEIPLRHGVKGIVAHAAGVGKNQAGIGGLPLADRYGIPAAAVETMEAKIADGQSLYAATISHANATAERLGVKHGMSTKEAARLMLAAPPGKPATIDNVVDQSLHTVHESDNGKVIAVWSILLVDGAQPNNVYCVASHSGETMAKFAKQVRPKGIIANDAGMAKDDSGIGGLPVLEKLGIAAAAVDASSAEIGDGLSTYRHGTISAANEKAMQAGVEIGMSANEGSRLMLDRETGEK